MLTTEEKARNLADGLGITVYIRDGRIYQHGPGTEIAPRGQAKPSPHGAPAMGAGIVSDGG
jgi:hypothetical protein